MIVVFCWLFGKMMDLPKGISNVLQRFKANTRREHRQCFTEYVKRMSAQLICSPLERKIIFLKQVPTYPKQDPSKSHNAIEDARWNQRFCFKPKL
jgi:hypothetical protein